MNETYTKQGTRSIPQYAGKQDMRPHKLSVKMKAKEIGASFENGLHIGCR